MEITNTNIYAVPTESDDNNKGEFLRIVYGDRETTNIIDVDINVFGRECRKIDYSKRSESYLIKVVRNFIRKNNYSELNELYEDGEITEEQYNLALDQYSEKYVITLSDINDPNDVFVISDLVNKIGNDLKEFSTGDVSEMFSVKENQLLLYANQIELK